MNELSVQGRTNRWKETLKHFDNTPLPSEQDDFFLKVWPAEKTEAKEQPADGAPPSARVTTADGPTGAEPRVRTLSRVWVKSRVFLCLIDDRWIGTSGRCIFTAR
jgi:hypothetical protein